jgi:threonine dehydratase
MEGCTLSDLLPGMADLAAAAARIKGVAHRTPIATSRRLDERAGLPVSLKLESLQRSGAFKFRGAYNAVESLPASCPGVVTYSSGNHAGALSLAAQLSGRRAIVVMPEDAPPAKVAAAEGYGAQIVRFDRFHDDRVTIATALAADHGFAVIPPFDHPDVIAGQGSVATELLEQAPDVDTIVVPVGGGGLLAGCALGASMGDSVRVIGVEPALADDFQRSLVAGEIVELPQSDTIADGLRSARPGELTFAVASALVSEIVTVSEDEIRDAMRFLFEATKYVVEPSGAVGVAALLSGRIGGVRHRAAAIVSGGNVSPEQFATLVGGGV